MRRALSRLTSVIVVAGFASVAVVLLWADRGAALGDRIVDRLAAAARGVERTLDVDLVAQSDLPPPTMIDQFGHAGLWAVGTLAVGISLRRHLTVAATAALMAAVSLGFELLQPVVSTSRRFQPSDARANLIGVLVAAVVLAGVLRVVDVVVERRRLARV